MKQIDLSSFSYKKSLEDTRNNWIVFQFLPKCRYKCFRRQSVIDSCTAGFKELERFGFKFGEMNFPLDHAHLSVDIPKKYSVQDAEIMLKDHSAKRIFAEHPGFRKRYPRGSFWAGYEHHESAGRKDRNEAEDYIRNQLKHHNVKIIDRRHATTSFYIYRRVRYGKSEQRGLDEERGGRGL